MQNFSHLIWFLKGYPKKVIFFLMENIPGMKTLFITFYTGTKIRNHLHVYNGLPLPLKYYTEIKMIIGASLVAQ